VGNREWWIVQTALSYTVGEPVYRTQDKEPDELTKRTSVNWFKVIEADVYEQMKVRAEKAEKKLLSLSESLKLAKRQRDEWNVRANEATDFLREFLDASEGVIGQNALRERACKVLERGRNDCV
jgi:hypothetical protein